LTDGLDGLATGASVMVIGAYAALGFWQYRHWNLDPAYCTPSQVYCYDARDPLEVALVAAAAAGACFGFLWWNASPARILMGGTGALGLGVLVAGAGVAGAASARALLDRGAAVTVLDRADSAVLSQLADLGATVVVSATVEPGLLDGVSDVVLSPVFAPHHPVAVAALSAG